MLQGGQMRLPVVIRPSLNWRFAYASSSNPTGFSTEMSIGSLGFYPAVSAIRLFRAARISL